MAFWTFCAERMTAAGLPARDPLPNKLPELYLRKPEDPYWNELPMRGKLFFAALNNTEDLELRVAFIIDHEEYGDRIFQALQAARGPIEAKLGETAEFDQGAAGAVRRQVVLRRRADIRNRQRWGEYADWIVEKLKTLRTAIRPHLEEALRGF